MKLLAVALATVAVPWIGFMAYVAADAWHSSVSAGIVAAAIVTVTAAVGAAAIREIWNT